jgi:DNA-binding Lrp family transcriptional regulator
MTAFEEIPGSFRSEAQMFEPLLDNISALFCADACATTVLTQAAIGNVIPDVLIGQWKSERPSDIPSLSNVSRHIVALLQRWGAAAPLDAIAEELYLSHSALTRAIVQLRKTGAISGDAQPGELLLSPDFEQRVSMKLIAIEVKMSRWREALQQAIRYLDFADEAYVVLDGNQIELTPEIVGEFELSAPGLYLQRGKEFQKIVEPCPVPAVPSADRLLAINKILSSRAHWLA